VIRENDRVRSLGGRSNNPKKVSGSLLDEIEGRIHSIPLGKMGAAAEKKVREAHPEKSTTPDTRVAFGAERMKGG